MRVLRLFLVCSLEIISAWRPLPISKRIIKRTWTVLEAVKEPPLSYRTGTSLSKESLTDGMDAKAIRRAKELEISKQILNIFQDNSLYITKNMKEIEIGIYYVRNKHALKRVHVLHILHEAAKAKIDITEIIDLSDLSIILNSSKAPYRAAEVRTVRYIMISLVYSIYILHSTLWLTHSW
jgi:hypothetical protein